MLLVLREPTDASVVEKSVRNLQMVRVAYARGLGTYDVLLADHVVFTGEALDALTPGARPHEVAARRDHPAGRVGEVLPASS